MNRLIALPIRAANVVRSAWAFALLATALRRRPPVELWIGDSHAQHYNRRHAYARLVAGPGGQFIYHHGPRLMYSVGTRGFDDRVQRFVRALRRCGSAGRVVPVFSAGEIDTRCHLVPRSKQPDFSLAFVARYLDRCSALASSLGATHALVAVPPPPAPTAPDRPGFPVRGTGQERIEMAERLRAEIHRAVSGHRGAVHLEVLDPYDELADAGRGLRPEFTDDQIHTNDRGRRVVRAAARAALERTAKAPG